MVGISRSSVYYQPRPTSAGDLGLMRRIDELHLGDLAFTYGAGGRLSAVQEEESSRSFSYNSLGQLTAETRTLGTVTATIGYGYNASTGELASMTYPSGRVVSFAHNAAGQITGIQVDGVPLASSIEYLPFGPVKRATLGTLSLGRSHDRRYQASRIQAGPLDYTYTRDKAGQVLAVTNLPSPTTADITETAAIEGDSNRITGLTGATAKSYSYDATGNIIIDGTLAYTWDALNRLVKVEQAGAVVATYGYDSQNRRIRKSVGDRTIHYHYDTNNLLIAETLADGTPLRDYFYLGGEPLALLEYKTNPGTYYFLNDHLGTPQQLVKPDGTVVWKAAYLPYGVAQMQLGTITNNLRFPGQYFDSETGLHYNWHRFYDPGTGRYISADPIGLAGGMNLYAYVQNDPVNWVDPWGLYTEIIIWQPVTWTSSSFGHVSSNVNGTNYSWTPDGWDTNPSASNYAQRQERFRSGVGTIFNLTPDQEKKLVECYAKKRKDYSKFTNNCGDPHKDCLQDATGVLFSDSFFPVNIGNDSLDSPYYKGSTFYSGPSRPFWKDALWAR